MTREEARLTLQENFGLLSSEYPGRITEALKVALEYLSQPSLPSNLDEAADTFNREDATRMWDYEGKTEGEIVEAAFKAGAEWVAGQGVTFETEVYESYTGKPFIEEITESFIPGDEVVVQIRKK